MMMKVVSMLLLCVLTQTMLSPLASAHVTASAMYPSRRMTTTHISMSSNLNSRGYGSSNNNYNNNINNNNYNKNMINNNNMNSDSQQGTDGAEGDMMMTPRSTVPSRKDTCRLFISGVVGTEPKEQFLSNGHHVLNFALAVVGHFNPVHPWERYKPTETMWVQTELWDDEAKEALGQIRKGSQFSGFGALILNKWTDKATGEEKKMFKVRILKQLPQDQINEMIGEFTEDVDAMYPSVEEQQTSFGGDAIGGGSSFSRSAPNDDNQLFQSPPPGNNNNNNNNPSTPPPRSRKAPNSSSSGKKAPSSSSEGDLWAQSRDPRVPF